MTRKEMEVNIITKKDNSKVINNNKYGANMNNMIFFGGCRCLNPVSQGGK